MRIRTTAAIMLGSSTGPSLTLGSEFGEASRVCSRVDSFLDLGSLKY